MKTIVIRAFSSMMLVVLLVGLNGCIVTKVVHKAVTLPIKAVTKPL